MKFYGRATVIGMIWSWLASAGTELMYVPTAMMTARLLTPEDFGISVTASFFVQLATRLTQFGFNAALLRMKEVSDEHASTIFVMNIAMGAASWLALTVSSPFIADFFHSPATGQILPIAALSFLAVPFGTVPSALLARELRYKEITYILWINTLTNAVVTIGLAWAGFGYWSLVYGQLAAAVVSSLAKVWFGRWRPSFRFTRQAARDTFSFGLGIYALRLVEYGALNLDSMTVGRMMGMTTLGFYDKAFNLMARVLDRLNQTGPTISFRVFAAIQDEPERFRRGFRKVTLSATLLGYPALTFLAVTARPLFLVLFGEKWLVSAPAFQILCVAGAFKMLNAYTASVIEAAGHVWAEVWRQVIYLALIVAGVVVMRAWGTAGAATAVLVATLVMTALLHQLLRSSTPLMLSDVVVPQLPAVSCSLGVALSVVLMARALNLSAISPLLQLLAMGTVSTIFFTGFVLLVPIQSVRDLVADVLEHLTPSVKKAFRLARPGAIAGARPSDVE